MFGGLELDPENEWVKLSKIIPWWVFEEEYAKQFLSGKGQPAESFRAALGSQLIKEKYQFSDEMTVAEIAMNQREHLKALLRTRTIQAQIMNRARILLLKANGESVDTIAEKVGLNRNSVLLCLKKFKEGGVENAITDRPEGGATRK